MTTMLDACYARYRRGIINSVSALGCACVLGCGGDPTATKLQDIDELLWQLKLNHGAINLSTIAPHNTIQLTAIAHNAAGDLLVDGPAVKYEISDPTKISVTPDGLVTAIATTSSVRVIASLQYHNVTMADTAEIRVTATVTPLQLASLHIDPALGDTITAKPSGYLMGQSTPSLVVRAFTADSVQIPNLVFKYWTDNPFVATIDRSFGTINPIKRGTTVFHVETTAYGVTRHDSIVCVSTDPLVQFITVLSRTTGPSNTRQGVFEPTVIRLAAGGIVLWSVPDIDLPVDIEFETPSSALAAPSLDGFWSYQYAYPVGVGGNIASFTKDPSSFFPERRARLFSTPGTYRYRSVLYGTTGTIIVR